LCSPFNYFFYFHLYYFRSFYGIDFFPDFIFWHLICWWFSFVRSYCSVLVFFNIDFVIIFNLFSMNLSWCHNLGYGFCIPFLNIIFFNFYLCLIFHDIIIIHLFLFLFIQMNFIFQNKKIFIFKLYFQYIRPCIIFFRVCVYSISFICIYFLGHMFFWVWVYLLLI